MQIIPKDRCTGCGLCKYVCPNKCISFVKGKLGHMNPKVNSEKCIECHLCSRICPSNNDLTRERPRACYAAWSTDNGDYISSSSGGAASVLSRRVIDLGGVVYGCAQFPGIRIKHIRVTKEDDLVLLKGSKYVQSSLKDVFPQLKKDVDEGRQTLFIGTPCQVASVKSLWKVIPNNILLVDIICHGVPSLHFLKNHVGKIVGSINNSFVSFRNGNEYNLTISRDEKKLYSVPLWTHRYEDVYLNAFMDGYSYRESCYQCKYASPERVSDITIGDFWGLGGSVPIDFEKPDNGISVILPITEKGIYWVDMIKDLMNLNARPIDEAIKGNSQLRAPFPKSKRARVFACLHPYFGYHFSYRIVTLDYFLKRK